MSPSTDSRRDALIRQLAANPAVAPGAGRAEPRALRWLLAATLLAATAIVWRQPLREGALGALLASPREWLEATLAGLAIGSAALAAFRSGVPSATPPWRQAAWPLALGAAWVLLLAGEAVAGLGGDPTAVKRVLCWLEVLGYGLPGLLLGLASVRRLWPLHGAWTGALLGLAAGGIPALIMDLACLDDPAHALPYHLLPAVALGALGALLGPRLLRRD